VLVSETVDSTQSTAAAYISELEKVVPRAAAANREAINMMVRSTQVATEEWVSSHEVPVQGEGGGYVLRTDQATPDEAKIMSEFPEIDGTLAGALSQIPNSIWGPLRPLLQGLIFHSIISAGYLTGQPPPAHPLALVNQGGGILGRRRTDLRNPTTFAVIEIKPLGDDDGQAQLVSYIARLSLADPRWHAALDVPTEAWPPTGGAAFYPLNPFGVAFTLKAWNNFAAEHGMLYYELVTTPGVPVYVPRHAPQPGRIYQFEFPRIVLPDLDLPELSPEAVATAAVGGMMFLILVAAIISPVPPFP